MDSAVKNWLALVDTSRAISYEVPLIEPTSVPANTLKWYFSETLNFTQINGKSAVFTDAARLQVYINNAWVDVPVTPYGLAVPPDGTITQIRAVKMIDLPLNTFSNGNFWYNRWDFENTQALLVETDKGRTYQNRPSTEEDVMSNTYIVDFDKTYYVTAWARDLAVTNKGTFYLGFAVWDENFQKAWTSASTFWSYAAAVGVTLNDSWQYFLGNVGKGCNEIPSNAKYINVGAILNYLNKGSQAQLADVHFGCYDKPVMYFIGNFKDFVEKWKTAINSFVQVQQDGTIIYLPTQTQFANYEHLFIHYFPKDYKSNILAVYRYENSTHTYDYAFASVISSTGSLKLNFSFPLQNYKVGVKIDSGRVTNVNKQTTYCEITYTGGPITDVIIYY